MTFNNELLQTLTNIRVDLLRYWQSETNQTLKDELSAHLNKLDDLIISKKKQLEQLQNTIGGK